MSSPMTADLQIDPGVVLVASAIRAAQAVAAAYAAAAELRARHEQDQATRDAVQREARQNGQAQLDAALQAAEERLQRLTQLATQMGQGDCVAKARPQCPAESDPASVAAYIRGLEALAEDLQRVLLTHAAQRCAAEPDLQDVLVEYLALPAQQVATQASARFLMRIAHLGAVPPDIATLAKELDATPPGERAELLMTELRLRIQRTLEAEQQRQQQEAAALIIEQSLKDLGYDVEEVAHTLYVEGGMVHFQRSDWGDYMVRMRLDFKRGNINFNVIRAVDEGHNERSVRDHLAEDRWCTEFPALMKALEAQGVHLNVTRRVEPGELPVQLVERHKLPKFVREEEQAQTKALASRTLK